MKKALKWVGIAFGFVIALVALGVGGVFAYIKMTPSPEDVCTHILGLDPRTQELPQALMAAGQTQCVARLQPPKYGMLRYAKTMRCLNGTEDMAGVQACENGQ